MKTTNKPQNIANEDWKYLIIFDACRYDRFQSHYKKYFNGVLEERVSPGRDTFEWLTQTWKEKYEDIRYISTVPFCNSKNKIKGHKIEFSAAEHFKKVYDLWDWGWNNKKGTILPQTVNSVARKEILKYPEHRFVIHYIQPHAPYLTFKDSELLKIFSNKKNEKGKKSISDKFKNPNLTDIYRWFLTKIRIIISDEKIWKIKKNLGVNASTRMEKDWRKVGSEGIKKFYDENLLVVMRHAKELISHLPPGKVIISADHGEFLGEEERWGHNRNYPPAKELVHVPWLEVER